VAAHRRAHVARRKRSDPPQLTPPHTGPAPGWPQGRTAHEGLWKEGAFPASQAVRHCGFTG
jgi:hypothetical protein